MTKKIELVWRLKNRPTVNEITDLKRDELITKEEARDLLFNSDQKDSEIEVKALKEQIKFLQDTVDKLINKLNSTGSPWVFQHTYTPYYPTRYWSTATTGTAINAGNLSMSTGGTVSYNASSLK